MTRLHFLTTNKGKFERASKFLQPEFELQNLDIEVDEPQHEDQQYVAMKKTEQAFDIVKKPVFTQDSGYYISKYNNFPGVITKNVVFGLGKDGIAKIIDENDEGYFQTTFAYKDSKNSFTLTAKIDGKFSLKNLYGEFSAYRTFGNIFIPNGSDKFFAECHFESDDDILKPHYEKLKDKILSMMD